MIALFFLSIGAYYTWMMRVAQPGQETVATHPASHLQVVAGGKLFTVVDGGLSETASDEDQRAA